MRRRIFMVVTCLLAAGCSGTKAAPAAGPNPLLQPSYAESTAQSPGSVDPLEAASVPSGNGEESATPRAKGVKDMTQLQDAIGTELSSAKPQRDLGVQVERRKYARYQIIVSWTVSDDLADSSASDQARADAVKILRLIQRTKLPSFGSVLLLANSAVSRDGGMTTTRVVRAKYTASAVRGTVFQAGKIWAQTDDKPAELSHGFH